MQYLQMLASGVRDGRWYWGVPVEFNTFFMVSINWRCSSTFNVDRKLEFIRWLRGGIFFRQLLAFFGKINPIADMAIVLVLVMQFNSLRRTAIVLATIPLGIIGVTVGLLVAKSTFGFFTFLGWSLWRGL